MTDRDQYVADIENAFQAHTEQEHEYVDHLIQRVFDFYNENKDAKYSDYIEYFGSPNELVISYFENQSCSEPIRKSPQKKWLKIIYAVIIICILIYSFFAFASFIEGRNHYIDGYNEVIVEE